MSDAAVPAAAPLSIRGGRVIDPANGVDAVTDLHLADGRVRALGSTPAGFRAKQTIDADGLVVCPGLVDLCARLRQPGFEQKATIASETRAAAAAGITTLCCPPDTLPTVDTPAVAQLIMQLADERAQARVLPAGALTRGLDGVQISEMAALQRAGCPVLSNADRPIRDTRVQRRALEYATTYGLTVFLHPADAYLSEGGLVHEGLISTRLGLPAIPEAAETVAVARDLALAEQTGARIHFRGLSTARATEMLAEARRRGIPVSADVSAHQLFLTEHALTGFDANAHVRPPLRTLADRDALRAALAAGEITAVCSDHQPHEPDAKLDPFPQTEPGISALETLLPLVLRLVTEDVLSLPAALACVTANPARILGGSGARSAQQNGEPPQDAGGEREETRWSSRSTMVDVVRSPGRLTPGSLADVCVFDPDARWMPGPETLLSRGHNTPFSGVELRGRVRWTLLAGRIVFSRGGAGAQLRA